MTLDLSVFTGSLRRFPHPTFPVLQLTEGVRHVGEQANAWWLLDHIGLLYTNHVHQFAGKPHRTMDRSVFQVWKIKFFADTNDMTIRLEDDNENLLTTWRFHLRAFPLAELTIWATDHVLLLPSEW